jgi:hypothetical protein
MYFSGAPPLFRISLSKGFWDEAAYDRPNQIGLTSKNADRTKGTISTIPVSFLPKVPANVPANVPVIVHSSVSTILVKRRRCVKRLYPDSIRGRERPLDSTNGGQCGTHEERFRSDRPKGALPRLFAQSNGYCRLFLFKGCVLSSPSAISLNCLRRPVRRRNALQILLDLLSCYRSR